MYLLPSYIETKEVSKRKKKEMLQAEQLTAFPLAAARLAALLRAIYPLGTHGCR